MSIPTECGACDSVMCVNMECANLTDEELMEVMGFDAEDITIIKEGEQRRV